MAKEVDVQKEIKKIWGDTKKNLLRLGQETVKLAKKGEREIIRASRIGRIQLDILGIKRRREILHQQIGAKVVALDKEGKVDIGGLKPLCKKALELDRQIEKKTKEAAKIKKAKKKK